MKWCIRSLCLRGLQALRIRKSRRVAPFVPLMGIAVLLIGSSLMPNEVSAEVLSQSRVGRNDRVPAASPLPAPTPIVSRPVGEMGSSADRSSLLRQLQRSCERFAKSPRVIGERTLVCRCVKDEHARRTNLADLRELVRFYRETHLTHDLNKSPASGDLEILLQYEIQIADDCMERLRSGRLGTIRPL